MALPVSSRAEKLTLDESVRIALANNASLKMAKENIDRTNADLSESVAQGMPKVSLNGRYAVSDEKAFASFHDDQIEVRPRDYGNANVLVTQSLDALGKIGYGKRMASLSRLVAKYDYDRVASETVLSVKRAYFNVLKAQRMVGVQAEAVGDLEANLRAVELNLKAGTVAPFEALRAQAQVANSKVDTISAENGLRLAKSAFNGLLGRDLDSDVDIEDFSTTNFVELPAEKCIKSAAESRPEVLSAQAQEELAQKMVGIQRSSGGLKSDLNLRYDRNIHTTFDNPLESVWTASVAASVPIYDGGATKAAVLKAKSDAESARLGKEMALSGVSLQARQALLTLNQNREQIAAADKGLQLAKESMRLAQVRYKGGISTQLEVLDARTALTGANANYVNALYDYQIALAELEQAVGGREQMSRLMRECPTDKQVK